jgi:hypothetical protein
LIGNAPRAQAVQAAGSTQALIAMHRAGTLAAALALTSTNHRLQEAA